MAIPPYQEILNSIWPGRYPVTARDPAEGLSEMRLLDQEQRIRLADSILENIDTDLSCIVEERLAEPLLSQLKIVKLISRQKIERPVLISDGVFAEMLDSCITVGAESLNSDIFKTVEKALTIFRKTMPLPLVDEISSRGSSDTQGTRTSSGHDKVLVPIAELSAISIPPRILPSNEFIHLLLESLNEQDCIVLGDGCHEDDALAQILSEPHLIEHLYRTPLREGIDSCVT